MSPTTLATAVGDFTQFVGSDGLALDADSLSQILQVFGVETEDEVIQQVVCTLTNTNQVQANITAHESHLNSASSEDPVSISTYTCSLPIPAKPGITETIPTQLNPNGIMPVAIS